MSQRDKPHDQLHFAVERFVDELIHHLGPFREMHRFGRGLIHRADKVLIQVPPPGKAWQARAIWQLSQARCKAWSMRPVYRNPNHSSRSGGANGAHTRWKDSPQILRPDGSHWSHHNFRRHSVTSRTSTFNSESSQRSRSLVASGHGQRLRFIKVGVCHKERIHIPQRERETADDIANQVGREAAFLSWRCGRVKIPAEGIRAMGIQHIPRMRRYCPCDLDIFCPSPSRIKPRQITFLKATSSISNVLMACSE